MVNVFGIIRQTEYIALMIVLVLVIYWTLVVQSQQWSICSTDQACSFPVLPIWTNRCVLLAFTHIVGHLWLLDTIGSDHLSVLFLPSTLSDVIWLSDCATIFLSFFFLRSWFIVHVLPSKLIDCLCSLSFFILSMSAFAADRINWHICNDRWHIGIGQPTSMPGCSCLLAWNATFLCIYFILLLL